MAEPFQWFHGFHRLTWIVQRFNVQKFKVRFGRDDDSGWTKPPFTAIPFAPLAIRDFQSGLFSVLIGPFVAPFMWIVAGYVP